MSRQFVASGRNVPTALPGINVVLGPEAGQSPTIIVISKPAIG